jgi:hypothetical protein
MGRASSVARLLRSELRFLTAVPRTAIDSHDVDLDIPHRFFSDYEPTCEMAPSDEEVTDVAAAQEQYAAAGRPMTAAACFETLATCRLNRYEPNELLDCDYSITQPTQEQATILRALGLTSLIRHQSS